MKKKNKNMTEIQEKRIFVLFGKTICIKTILLFQFFKLKTRVKDAVNEKNNGDRQDLWKQSITRQNQSDTWTVYSPMATPDFARSWTTLCAKTLK